MAALFCVTTVKHGARQLDKVQGSERFIGCAEVVEMPPPHIVDIGKLIGHPVVVNGFERLSVHGKELGVRCLNVAIGKPTLPRDCPHRFANTGHEQSGLFKQLTNGPFGVRLLVVYSPARSDPSDHWDDQ